MQMSSGQLLGMQFYGLISAWQAESWDNPQGTKEEQARFSNSLGQECYEI